MLIWLPSAMAAIIAQMTRANRERKRKRRTESRKCMYELEPFDTHFQPAVSERVCVCDARR